MLNIYGIIFISAQTYSVTLISSSNFIFNNRNVRKMDEMCPKLINN